ncbi:MAG: ABC transporter permease [Phycisphaerales bacterium]
MTTLWYDVRYGFRMLARSPGFTLVVVLIFAVGIGASTAVFSVVNAVILRPLPYPDGHRLVVLRERSRNKEIFILHARLLFCRDQNQVFERVGAFWGCRPHVTGIAEARHVRGATVSADMFPLLGVSPLLGRVFLPGEDQPGNDRVIVLSHAFWQSDFGGDPNAVGKTVALDGKDHTIVGVMPPSFEFPFGQRRVFWVPLVLEQDSDWPSGRPVAGLARLKRDVTLEQARAAMAVISDRLKETDPEANVVAVRRLLDERLGANRQLLWLLLGAAGFVLLIACTNVASLLLARATIRQAEMAMRVAVGASRNRVVRQVLTESLLLSVAGGMLGLLVTFWTVRGLVRLCPADIPRLDETSVDGAVLAFTLGAVVLTGLLSGVVPACRASDVRIGNILREGRTRSSTGRGWQRLHGGLVIVQTGLSLVLLIGAALLIRTWIALQRVDLGFEPEHAMTAEIALPESRYSDPNQRHAFCETLLQRVRTLPGIRSAGVTDLLALGVGESNNGAPFSIIGQPPADPDESPVAMCLFATPGFLESMGVRLLKGRPLTESDMQEPVDSVIIDENVARKYFAGIDPIGLKISLYEMKPAIIGVVSALKDFEHLDPRVGKIFLPLTQSNQFMVLVVRTEGDPMQLAGAIRSQVAALDKDGVDVSFEGLDAYLSGMIAPQRFSVVLLGLFAGMALTLAAVGIYGLLQYSTSQQTHDIGIHVALGARKEDVLKAVLARGLRLTLVGVVIGLAGAWGLTRFLSSLLYGVPPTDWPTFACVSLVFIGIAMLASYLPARRAARVDPMAALRCE